MAEDPQGPVARTFAFRGIMLDGLERHLPFHVANLVQAFAFSLMHQEGVLFVFLMLFGWTAGLMRRSTGGLAAPLLFHTSNNLIAFMGLTRLLS